MGSSACSGARPRHWRGSRSPPSWARRAYGAGRSPGASGRPELLGTAHRLVVEQAEVSGRWPPPCPRPLPSRSTSASSTMCTPAPIPSLRIRPAQSPASWAIRAASVIGDDDRTRSVARIDTRSMCSSAVSGSNRMAPLTMITVSPMVSTLGASRAPRSRRWPAGPTRAGRPSRRSPLSPAAGTTRPLPPGRRPARRRSGRREGRCRRCPRRSRSATAGRRSSCAGPGTWWSPAHDGPTAGRGNVSGDPAWADANRRYRVAGGVRGSRPAVRRRRSDVDSARPARRNGRDRNRAAGCRCRRRRHAARRTTRR